MTTAGPLSLFAEHDRRHLEFQRAAHAIHLKRRPHNVEDRLFHSLDSPRDSSLAKQVDYQRKLQQVRARAFEMQRMIRAGFSKVQILAMKR